MTGLFLPVLFGALLLPALAQAQPGAPPSASPAREGNIWDFTAHQPTAGDVQAQEKNAAIAPSEAQVRRNQDQLDAEGRQLLEQAARDRKAAPGTDVYGVAPGGVVPISPAPH
jgi:hypothetical protein